jgi:hypothetical protein
MLTKNKCQNRSSSLDFIFVRCSFTELLPHNNSEVRQFLIEQMEVKNRCGKSVSFAETMSSYTAVFTFIQTQQIIWTVAIGGRFTGSAR